MIIDAQGLSSIPISYIVPLSTTVCLRLLLSIRKTCYQSTLILQGNEQAWDDYEFDLDLDFEGIQDSRDWGLGLWGSDVASEGELRTLSAIY